jgi:hypothetical protein
MYLTSSQLLEMTEEKLLEFLALGIPENSHLDYKISLSNKSDKESKREFLKDISGFANASGGHLIIGVQEPTQGLPPSKRLTGIDNGPETAAALERLASSSIEPRIPGLRIFPLSIGNGRHCLIVHVPPSLGRPHMVSHDGHRSFYIRHTESIFPMSTYEIRQAVLTSTSAEDRARNTAELSLAKILEKNNFSQANLVLQAIPLIKPDTPWDVLNAQFTRILNGDNRRNLFEYETLENYSKPRPTIYGISCANKDWKNPWSCEIRRSGHIILNYKFEQLTQVNGKEIRFLHSGNVDIFGAFLMMLDAAIEESGNDVPYLITAYMSNAQGLRIWTESRHTRFSEAYDDDSIAWPEHIRQTGEAAVSLKAEFGRELFNAFGFPDIVE